MKKRIVTILIFLLSLTGNAVWASHIVGGDFIYKYQGDTIINSQLRQKYTVTLYIYQDCNEGVLDAIAQDNPAHFTVYRDDGSVIPYRFDTNIFYNPNPTSDGAIQVPPNFSNDCVTKIPNLCLLRKKFEKTYYLPPSTTGYVVVYQRCCRNASILNVLNPGDEGATYYCHIPPSNTPNNSAVFKNYPPQIICINNPLYYDNSATDADGDSLSYEFCVAEEGATGADIKPKIASPPPFVSVVYAPSYTYQNPINGFPVIQIDPVSGIITGTPNRIGRFLVTICCSEWRNGAIINTVKREFQFVVTDCSKVVVADIPLFTDVPNTYIINCKDYNVNFVNTSKGGFNYRWDFGVPEIGDDVSTEFQPSYTYPDTGTYTVKLVVNPGTTCPDSITRLVKIYPRFFTNFTDSGVYCPGSPIFFTDQTIATIKPIIYWKWSFGDGNSSTEQNPTHTFKTGGTFNVVMISENIKNCVDTSLRRVVVQNFKPFAGDDTIIVRGETIQFQAQGGTTYAWSPPTLLSDTGIANPLGNFSDTGFYSYSVFVRSDYGCYGYDTVRVWVVNKASFTLPTAFTPNGDGLNDFFRPLAVGYRNLKYFRVFNRWGEQVFYGESIENGWNGTHNNQPAEMGVYFWQIVFIDRFGVEGQVKGDVTLIR